MIWMVGIAREEGECCGLISFFWPRVSLMNNLYPSSANRMLGY